MLVDPRVNTAVDDYGTGSLPLSQLRRIAVDLLKIDRFLVRNMLSDRPSRDVVELLLTLGHHWKIHVLAQGIEKPSQCEGAEAATQLLRDQLSAHPVPARTH